MKTFLLDTSAIMAHVFREPGCDRVQRLIDARRVHLLVSSASLLETAVVLKTRVRDAGLRQEIVEMYGGQLAEVVPVERDAAMAAIELRDAASSRLPAVDALIAGCAAANDAVLVHRDPHFAAIPSDALRQLDITGVEEDFTPPDDEPVVVRESRTKYKTRKGRSPIKS